MYYYYVLLLCTINMYYYCNIIHVWVIKTNNLWTQFTGTEDTLTWSILSINQPNIYIYIYIYTVQRLWCVTHVLKLYFKSSHTNLRVDNGEFYKEPDRTKDWRQHSPLHETNRIQSTYTCIFVHYYPHYVTSHESGLKPPILSSIRGNNHQVTLDTVYRH